MAHVEVRVEGKDSETLRLDRVPVKGDYIVSRSGTLLVTGAALVAGAMVEGIVVAETQTDNQKFA